MTTAARRILALVLACTVAGCGRGGPEGRTPDTTIQEYMEQQIGPAADHVFRSVRDVADAQGQRLEQPRSEAEWKAVEARLEILRDAPAVLTAPGIRVAPAGFKAENPAVESEPAAIEAALARDRADFDRRAYRLQTSAAEALLAAKARDPLGMVRRLEDIDRACESCHLRYFYPGDGRAQMAARAAYIVN